MTRSQRIVLVIALGAVSAIGAQMANRLLQPPVDGGWFAYAPNTGAIFSPGADDGQVVREAAIWLLAVLAWVVPSFWLLRDDAGPRDRGDGP